MDVVDFDRFRKSAQEVENGVDNHQHSSRNQLHSKNSNLPVGPRFSQATNKPAYIRGYMMAAAGYFCRCNIAVLNNTGADCCESFDLASFSGARVASDWIRGWLDGRDRLPV